MHVQKSAIALGLVLAITGLGACDSGEGGGQRTKGRFEAAAGSLTGDDKLKHEGKKDEVIGGVKDTVGDIKGAVHDAEK